MSVMRVACASTPDWIPHAAATIRSVLDHRGDLDAEILYLHGPALPKADGDRLREMVESAGAGLRLLEVPDERVAGLPAPPAQWYRTFLGELAPDVDRVLYLDVDTIVVDDLGPLWATDLGADVLGAVANVWEPWNAGYPASVGITGENAYFNSGVLLMDLAAMRAEDAAGAVVAYALEHKADLPWGDQTPLNVAFAGRWRALHPRYNAMTSVLTFPQAVEAFGEQAVVEARERPAIRHFEGPSINKPWHVLCPAEDRRAYLRARRRTPWPRVRRTGVTPRNLARRALRDLRRAAPGGAGA
jgi:lipopolysaccharide biosynthesis glycosyltransferase